MGRIKKSIHKAIIAVMILFCGAVVFILSLKTPFVSEHPLIKLVLPSSTGLSSTQFKSHFYEEPEISLEKIHIQAFYLVPETLQVNMPASWKDDFTKALIKIREFHSAQFKNSSNITFSLLETPVLTQDEIIASIPVGIDRPSRVDLTKIDQFIESKILTPGAFFYRSNFAEIPPGAFVVKLIFLEGPAALGAEGIAILSRSYFTDPVVNYGTSFLYHEFGHALGMPDLYDSESGETFSDGIMGSGRYRYIDYVHLDQDIKVKMGIK
ncbi:MAG: hypothetical protein A3A80_01225 [Candidatus Terrybacteria bacterium RIFCSPLOWO2_01_FULL_44_24]|uniref:Uncharacterized protein n=1 Tax=Candidatus Terrybacteria bacterium RIFCSPHIGHO2_01_FULL_43_35 TaxID=1802361 RepID=A0A1G2PHE5_9BACT|nr:MAG: hypothetical protein A2828_03605 [Candidatus Terrybacteria bacterium RIFCSPHIGHO2_01_FULL_43_35]OHA50416.1 MAG: hypothetical protein A3B75_02670 [Candidatus Terrybacteria bacterium RIFCSPHIGHO2_02_FULL_43_14]OHA51705.1 MAG: hypothetical protein A3A80_01225 [Candidatus Terrybacteria bacterium RIFCSPLOWO2_01_FULL_44_24]